MPDVTDITAAMKDRIDDIVEEWRAHVRGDITFASMEPISLDHLPALVRYLMAVIDCSPDAATARGRLVSRAADHGAYRRDEGKDENLLFREHYLLRAAIDVQVRKVCGDGDAASEEVMRFLLRLDKAMSVATRTSVHGYYRKELTERGSYEELLEKLAQAGPWPLCPPAD